MFPDGGVCTLSVWINPHAKTYTWLREGDRMGEKFLTLRKRTMLENSILKFIPAKRELQDGLPWPVITSPSL
jgi:hypothetical protein